MVVFVNGCEQDVSEPQTLAELLARFAPATPFAVARNEEFVPAGHYHGCTVIPGDRIEIVSPMSGG